jgi:hypothetical protein
MSLDGGCPMLLVVSPETVAFIRDRGGLLFVWPSRSHGPRCTLTMLRASLDPPSRALEFRRIALPELLLFLHPDMRSLPTELWVEVHGQRFPHVNAYWDGLAYVA